MRVALKKVISYQDVIPSTLICGELVRIKGIIYDLIPNQDIHLYVSIDNYIFSDFPIYQMGEDYTLNFEINFTAPYYNGYKYMYLWAECGNISTNKESYWKWIHPRPKIFEYEPLDPQYSIGEAINFEFKGWSPTSAYIRYKFDEKNEWNDLGEYKQYNNDNLTLRYQIPTKDKIFLQGQKKLQ
ncbi:hypothetical protein TVAG_054390 [Trichomonas vaginalis G3]|uniref:Uncharacterized protein n=1 Tax=Trichomonas vaginalis (strain ATCC PRA-98 / G3) TaxID=412133 RepID=A2EYB4_TRIV3|nr:hypothetical protein TVAGG3_0774360 [Trichomonas vaginalis G3]EAY02341.1 hypothetical protein TVAG_054390 [Trichomonas vaginalis G3]KAI5514055.1 hypothetical protein TVAGG3_0774360 [Trichomonas vaginalis G3]|eukprot:XP_001314656.1 hypothetical protein [Trichomonas vaginalis G3]